MYWCMLWYHLSLKTIHFEIESIDTTIQELFIRGRDGRRQYCNLRLFFTIKYGCLGPVVFCHILIIIHMKY